VDKIEIASSKVLSLVAARWFETKTSRVDKRHNRHLTSAVGQVCAASASIVGQLYVDEVFVGDEATVACRLHH